MRDSQKDDILTTSTLQTGKVTTQVNPTPGSIVEIVTPRGLGVAIISNINDTEYKGYLVKNNNHNEIIGEWDGLVEEIITTIPNQRAVVLEYTDGYLMVTTTENNDTYHISGTDIRPKTKHTPHQTINYLINTLNALGEQRISTQISSTQQLWENNLKESLTHP